MKHFVRQLNIYLRRDLFRDLLKGQPSWALAPVYLAQAILVFSVFSAANRFVVSPVFDYFYYAKTEVPSPVLRELKEAAPAPNVEAAQIAKVETVEAKVQAKAIPSLPAPVAKTPDESWAVTEDTSKAETVAAVPAEPAAAMAAAPAVPATDAQPTPVAAQPAVDGTRAPAAQNHRFYIWGAKFDEESKVTRLKDFLAEKNIKAAKATQPGDLVENSYYFHVQIPEAEYENVLNFVQSLNFKGFWMEEIQSNGPERSKHRRVLFQVKL